MYYHEALSHKVAATPPPRTGIIDYLNGSYTGQLNASSIPNGNGVYTDFFGKKISGVWRNGKLNLSSVTIEHTSGEYTYKYEGFVNKNFQRHGKGKLTVRKKTKAPSGAGDIHDAIITGDWSENNPSGTMTKVDQFGTYRGELDDMLERSDKNATLRTRDGRKITGKWGSDYPMETMTVLYSDGSKYKGKLDFDGLQPDDQSGRARLETKDGRLFKGRWKAGKITYLKLLR